MNTLFLLAVPAFVLMALCAPLLPALRGRVGARSARRRLVANLCVFAAVCLCAVALPLSGAAMAASPEAGQEAAAAVASASITGTNAQGMGFLAAALVTGLAAIGAGVAVAAAAPAAIGAVSENAKAFGKAIIFVVLGEGIAIYGLLISILIINKL